MAFSSMRQYRFEENEALDGRQMVTVKDTTSGKSIWTKTRDLVDDEIVSTVFDSLHNPRWRVHRPTKGWYLILQRRPDEPYIELKPAAKLASPSASSSSAASGLDLVFTVRTPPSALVSPAVPPSAEGRKSPSVRLDMSPPPPDAASSAMSPSLSSVSAASSSTAVSSSSTTALALDPEKTPTKRTFSPSTDAPSAEAWQSSTFRLQSSIPPSFTGGNAEGGLLNRLKGLVSEPKKRWSVVWEEAGEEGGKKVPAAAGAEKVVLSFEEHSSGFFHPHLTGVLSLSPALIDASGLEPSFWVALCCAYADVLEEKDGWEAAKEGD
ncbi:hypothetical protein JCM6882_005193 [Rhodosporidiobolus microsporus]